MQNLDVMQMVFLEMTRQHKNAADINHEQTLCYNSWYLGQANIAGKTSD